MKKAVVFYSMSGNTEFIAGRIAERLGADIIRIEPKKAFPDKGFRKFFWGGKSAVMGDMPELVPYSFDADEYDTVIIGTPVWASCVTPPIKSFLNENKEKLAGKKIAVFVCFSGGGADKAIDKLKKLLGIDTLEGKLILIDPKDKPCDENEEKIARFCSGLI